MLVYTYLLAARHLQACLLAVRYYGVEYFGGVLFSLHASREHMLCQLVDGALSVVYHGRRLFVAERV